MSEEKKEIDGSKPLRVIVNSVAFHSTRESVEEFFSKYGEIEDILLPEDSNGRPKGFAFLTFAKGSDALPLLAEDADLELDGRRVRVQVAKERKERKPRGDRKPRNRPVNNNKLYVGDLPWELSAEELREYFEQFGEVQDAYLAEIQFAKPVNGYTPHRGFGFVVFEKIEDAAKAVNSDKQLVLKGSPLRVSVARPDEKKKERRERKNGERSNSNRRDGDRKKEKGAGGAAGGKREGAAGNSNKEGRKQSEEKGKKGSKKSDASSSDKEAGKGDAEQQQQQQQQRKRSAEPQRRRKPKAKPFSKAPSQSPWGAAPAAASVATEQDPQEFPSLADVASGKVKPKSQKPSNIYVEPAPEAKKPYKGKGKGEAEPAAESQQQPQESADARTEVATANSNEKQEEEEKASGAGEEESNASDAAQASDADGEQQQDGAAAAAE